MYLPDQNMHVVLPSARVTVSEIAALHVQKTDSSFCTNLCEECGKELETHFFCIL